MKVNDENENFLYLTKINRRIIFFYSIFECFTCVWAIWGIVSVFRLVGTIDDNEFEFVPSEENAESEELTAVGSWLRLIVTGDFDNDECELLGRRRGIILLGRRCEGGVDCAGEVVLLLFVFFFRINWNDKECGMTNHW